MHPGKHAYSPDQPSFFFFNDTATTEIYTLSLHDALPISPARHPGLAPLATPSPAPDRAGDRTTVDLSCLLLPVCEQHPQAAPRVKHFRSDRSLGNSEDRGDLTVRAAFDVEQHYRQAPPLAQLGERLAQPLVQRPPLGRRVGSRGAGREPHVGRLDPPDRAAPPPLPGGQQAQRPPPPANRVRRGRGAGGPKPGRHTGNRRDGHRPELVPRALVRLLGNGRRGGGGRSNEPGREESATGLQHDLAAGREVAQELLRQRGGELVAFGEEIQLVVPE